MFNMSNIFIFFFIELNCIYFDRKLKKLLKLLSRNIDSLLNREKTIIWLTFSFWKYFFPLQCNSVVCMKKMCNVQDYSILSLLLQYSRNNSIKLHMMLKQFFIVFLLYYSCPMIPFQWNKFYRTNRINQRL